MTSRTHRLESLLFTVLLSASALGAERRIKSELWGGVDLTGGDVTYEIGGQIRQGPMVEDLHFPISRLEWPLNAAMLSLGGSVEVGAFDARAVFSKNAARDAGKMKDSDWEIDEMPDVLTTYSESDTEFDAWQADGSVRYWVLFPTGNPKETVRLGGGIGVLYQDFSWEAKDTDQWYPQRPDLGHDILRGVTITYDARVLMPYIDVGGKMTYGPLYFEGRLGWSPYTQVEDVDDHKLRYIRAETTSDGAGAFAELLGRYTFSNGAFLQCAVHMLAFETKGTEKDFVYAGPDYGTSWEIEHEVRSSQARLTLAGGMAF